MQERNAGTVRSDSPDEVTEQSTYDSIVIGGGPAGLSTALLLGRSLRQTLVCDSGEYVNEPADESHGFLTQDGTSPTELRQRGRDDLTQYETITYQQTTVGDVDQSGGEFIITLDDGRSVATRTVVLATGVEIELPAVDGFEELWGSTVIQCPYCHGWEIRNEAHAVYAPNPEVMAYAAIVSNWSDDITLLTDGNSWLNDEHRNQLAANDITINERAMSAVEGDAEEVTMIFENGEQQTVRALWTVPDDVHQRSPLADELGCSLADNGLIETDGHGRSSVDGVYVAGDISHEYEHSQLSLAVGNGAMTAITVNMDLAQTAFNTQ